jgi:hypothetical protein
MGFPHVFVALPSGTIYYSYYNYKMVTLFVTIAVLNYQWYYVNVLLGLSIIAVKL